MRRRDLHFFVRAIAGVGRGVADTQSVLETVVVGRLAEYRVLAVEVRDSPHADEKLRAG